MNKTLLLILVDFLLLTLLSMTKWDEERAAKASDSPMEEATTSSLAVMEQDMLDTLEDSLQEERRVQLELEEAMRQREEELKRQQKNLESVEKEAEERASQIAALAKNLQEKESNLKSVQEEVGELKNLSSSLQDEVVLAKRKIDEEQSRFQSLELQAKQSEAQARLLQTELKTKLDELAKKEENLKKLEAEKAETESLAQELGMQVRLVEEEKKYLRDNLDTLKREVEVVREEKQVLQEQTGLLAEGVTQLAERSEDIKQEIRSNTPINANQLYSDFLSNQVTTTYVSQRFTKGRVIEESDEVKTLLVSDGSKTYALTHIARTPIEIDRNIEEFRRLDARFGTNGESARIETLEFLALDPRIAAVEVDAGRVERLGVKTYYTAIDPYKFEQAVLINSQGDYYGEVEFKLDQRTPGYVRMQSKVFSRIFGEFSPSVGDLVLSKTGELLGIMVDRRNCLVIDTLLTRENIKLDRSFNQTAFEATVRSLRDRYDALPSQIR